MKIVGCFKIENGGCLHHWISHNPMNIHTKLGETWFNIQKITVGLVFRMQDGSSHHLECWLLCNFDVTDVFLVGAATLPPNLAMVG